MSASTLHACPYCGNTNLAEIAGVEVAKVYDGALYWECLKCGHAWHRWPKGDRRYFAAAPLIAQTNP